MNDEQTEQHPAFGKISVSRVSSGKGVSLFGSEINHQHYISMRIAHAERKRSLGRDWIFGKNEIIEVNMSFAQWAEMVSSIGNGEGTPATITYLNGARVDQIPTETRTKRSLGEVRTAAAKAIQKISDAANEIIAAYDAKAGRREMGDKINGLVNTLNNIPSDMAFAGESLSNHVETVVSKARADIEAMVAAAAERSGMAIDNTNYIPTLGIEA